MVIIINIDWELDKHNEEKLLEFLDLKKSEIARFSYITIDTINGWSFDVIEPQLPIFNEKVIVLETKTGGYNSELYCMSNSKLFKHPKFITAFNYNGDMIYMRFFFKLTWRLNIDKKRGYLYNEK